GVAEWIEALGRPEEHAEMVAHHWRSALELTRAAGRDDVRLEERTRFAFREAGDRAFALNSHSVAASYYEQALEIWPVSDPERPMLLFQRARALTISLDDRRVAALEEARDALVAARDRAGAAEAEACFAQVAWYQGHDADKLAHLAAAEELVAGAVRSPSTTRVLAFSARYRMLAGDYEGGLALAREASALAEELRLDELHVHALITIGTA